MNVIDTDVFIDLFRGVEDARIFFHEHNTLFFSSVTEAELLAGKECDDPIRREEILHFLSRYEKIPLDNPLVQIAGDYKRKYGVQLLDAFIAATAAFKHVTLITRNFKDFEKIKEIDIKKPY